MFVIAFANPKGGSGKTTSAMLLAEQITVSGGRVSVLDFDPNANIRSWAQSREADGKDVPFAVHARPQAEDTVELVDSLAGDADYLIVDLDGSRDQIVTFALSRTDLCVIPLDGSAMEARQAAQAVRLVQTTGNMIRHEINGSDSPMARFFADQGCKSESRGKRQGRIVVGGCWRLPLLPTPGEHSPCPVEAIRPEQ